MIRILDLQKLDVAQTSVENEPSTNSVSACSTVSNNCVDQEQDFTAF